MRMHRRPSHCFPRIPFPVLLCAALLIALWSKPAFARPLGQEQSDSPAAPTMGDVAQENSPEPAPSAGDQRAFLNTPSVFDATGTYQRCVATTGLYDSV